MPGLLIVGDEPTFANLAKQVAAKAGHTVQIARSAAEFAAALGRSTPDITILDVFMPGLDGIEVVESLADRRYRGKLVVATGANLHYAEVVRRFGLAHGIKLMATLRKPVKEAELLRLLA